MTENATPSHPTPKNQHRSVHQLTIGLDAAPPLKLIIDEGFQGSPTDGENKPTRLLTRPGYTTKPSAKDSSQLASSEACAESSTRRSPSDQTERTDSLPLSTYTHYFSGLVSPSRMRRSWAHPTSSAENNPNERARELSPLPL
jgi:hypothetical protein